MVGPLRHVTKNNPVKKEEKPIFPFFMKDNTKNNKDEIFTLTNHHKKAIKPPLELPMMITLLKAFYHNKASAH